SIKRTGAGFQSIIDCIYSPTMIFLAALFLGDPITSHQVIGATFIILSILLSSRGFSSQENQSSGIIFGVLAQISVVIGILIITDLFSKVSILHLTTLRLLFGQFFLVLIMRPKKEHLKTLFWPVERKEFKYVFLSALFGSFLATYFWLLGFKYSVVGNAAIYNQTSSLFIFILAWIFLKEQFTLKKGFSLIMALLGAIAVSL
ncbi:MAG: DMT family transporter, partial [Bdellovibrionales bacterium]|nr:DMT family transporter [Bdellovibrionales bacterium]